ncbi:hypothetical protein [Sulfitobacter sabulilitoris]|uniref:Uncharacterized protein n=1 Tax=Sulfitobacter sabulilitoris TaxID=2562655 RepID=A0A5S3PP56_9RHOB|nr:hypothetical protein [Sulfitobacter sabulilitoris]TMM54295.1 hypothetical protein FDT80_01480 [Sulfitobacter sabulilitoris]
MTARTATAAKAIDLHPVGSANGTRMILRGVQRVIGASLVLSVLGLWIAPGSNWESDPLLMKLLMSVVAGLAGVALLQASARPSGMDSEIDIERGEIRLVRTVGGHRDVVQRCSFDALSDAEVRGNQIRFWDADGAFIAEVTLTACATRQELTQSLRRAGKI